MTNAINGHGASQIRLNKALVFALGILYKPICREILQPMICLNLKMSCVMVYRKLISALINNGEDKCEIMRIRKKATEIIFPSLSHDFSLRN